MGRHGEQLAADRADLGIELAGIHERLNEIRQQQNVRVQGKDPVAAGKPDRLILSSGEADVFLVVVDLSAVLELFQNVNGAVGGSVVHNDELFERVALLDYRFDAAFDDAAAIVGD